MHLYEYDTFAVHIRRVQNIRKKHDGEFLEHYIDAEKENLPGMRLLNEMEMRSVSHQSSACLAYLTQTEDEKSLAVLRYQMQIIICLGLLE